MTATPSNPIDPDAPLAFVLSAAARKLAKFYAAALKSSPLTPSQLFFLRQLWLEDGLALTVVRERAQLDATSATWLADQLEKAGLIERRRGAPDRRIVRVFLTGSGRNLRDELQPQIARWEHSFEDVLLRHHAPREVAAFRAVLGTLIAALPEGDDLWEALSRQWDDALASLRDALESSPPG